MAQRVGSSRRQRKTAKLVNLGCGIGIYAPRRHRGARHPVGLDLVAER